jgi:hypothetical protein
MAHLSFKVTRWEKLYIPNDKVEEVIKRLKESSVDDVYDLQEIDGVYSEPQSPDEAAEEAMTAEENDNQATQELYDSSGNLIFSNEPIDRSSIEWICTDPDNDQWGRKLGEGHYEFKERNPAFEDHPLEEDEYVQMDILLDRYTDEEVENIIGGYYGSLPELKAMVDVNDIEWILAECIFEYETGFY